MGNIDLANLTLADGFSIAGAAAGDNSGTSVSCTGDFNRDGFDDLVLGAPAPYFYTGSGAGHSYVIYGGKNLTNMDLGSPAQALTITNAALRDLGGWSVSGVGDINKDGYGDVLIGAYQANPQGQSSAGESWLVYGGHNITNFNLTSISPTQGFAILGAVGGDWSGLPVGRAGDVNQDGYDDFIIGASGAASGSKAYAGKTYIIYGGKNLTTIGLANLPPSQGITILGALANDRSGYAVSAAGDVNKDGFPDIIMGAINASPNQKNQAGQSYVVYGGPSLSTIDLSKWSQSLGFVISGATAGDQAGYSVSGAGDVNQDGYDDFIIGAPTAAPDGKQSAGAAYIVYGGRNITNIDLSALSSTQGIAILGASLGDWTGRSVSGAGDVNGDGYDDILIGAPFATANGRSEAGVSYLIYGGPGLSTIDLANATSFKGMFIFGAVMGDRSGYSVAGECDVNKDGYDDLIIGAYAASPNGRNAAGNSYVVYGAPTLFAPAVSYAVGSNPEGIDVGDINHDGQPDLVVGNWGGTTISQLLGNNGTFLPSIFLTANQKPYNQRLADFNKDGNLDIVNTNAGSNDVSVLLGNKNGTFRPAVFYSVGGYPYDIGTADFDRDGNLDFVNTNNIPGTISVFIGKGDGSFQPGNTYNVGLDPTNLITADFNKDGKPDIANTNRAGGFLSVFLGKGDGSFQQPVFYNLTGVNPLGIVADDFDFDGSLDLGFTNWVASGQVGVLKGYGNGTFALPPTYYSVGAVPRDIKSVDLNLDGNPDLVCTNENTNNIAVLYGYGNGTFQPASFFGVGSGPQYLIHVDIDGDGRQDIITTNGNDDNISLLRNAYPINTTFSLTSPNYYSLGINPVAITTADFNKDGALDAAIADSRSNSTSIMLSDGQGGFGSPSTYPVGSASWWVESADFNKDGKLDLAVANANVAILLGNGDGTFQNATTYIAGNNSAGLTIADFNKDGRLDIATADYDAHTASILFGKDDGSFMPPTAYLAGTHPSAITTGDLRNNGKLDLVVSDWPNNLVSVLLGNGNGTFQAAATYGTGRYPQTVSLKDLNRDGVLDLTVANADAGSISILMGNGDGTFKGAVDYSTADASSVMHVIKDLNLDGKDDIVTTNYNPDSISVLLGNGDGSFQSPLTYNVTGPWGLTIADLDHNGRPDILTTGRNYQGAKGFSGIAVLLNGALPLPSTTTTTSSTMAGPPSTNSTSTETTATSTSTSSTTSTPTSTPTTTTVSTTTGTSTPTTSPFYASNIDLANLTLAGGFSIVGATAGDNSGWSVSNAGDVNGDGYQDVIIGASYASPKNRTYAGQSYVVYGGGNLSNIDLANFSLSQGFVISGAVAGDFSGRPVSGAGDVNNDGYDDVVIGAAYAAPNGKVNAGQSYVIYGSKTPLDIDLLNLTLPQGIAVTGVAGSWSGVAVSRAGDVNKDSYADFIIGAYQASPNERSAAGQSYIIYGSANLTHIDLANLTSIQGISIIGATPNDHSGGTVSDAGDVNNDGYDDAIIGAYGASPDGKYQAGISFMIYGGHNLSNVDLVNLTASQGFAIFGAVAGDYSGSSLSAAGDVNKDGFDDVIIGAHYASPDGRAQAGQSYVIYGGMNLSNLNLTDLSALRGFTIIGDVGTWSGYSVGGSGDMNEDGYADVIIGANLASPNNRTRAGQTYIIYGGANLANLDLANFSTSQGFSVIGTSTGDQCGGSVSNAGDVNKDGYADLVIGTAAYNGRTNSGTSYVIYGGPKGIRTTTTPTTSSSTITATTLTVTQSVTNIASPQSSTARTSISSIAIPTSLSTSTASTIASATTSATQSTKSSTTPLTTATTTSPLVTSTSSVSSFASPTSTNITLQSGGRTTTSASSLTGVIVGTTVGVLAAIGAGYLAYKRWRGHGRGIDPQVKAAAGAVTMIDPEGSDDPSRMQTNPVYEGVSRQALESQYGANLHEAFTQQQYEVLEGQYEQPHIDTWSEAYDTGHQGTRIAESALRLRTNTQWDPRNYETANPQRPFYETIIHDGQQSQLLGPDYNIVRTIPKIYLDDSAEYPTYEKADPTHSPWGFEEA